MAQCSSCTATRACCTPAISSLFGVNAAMALHRSQVKSMAAQIQGLQCEAADLKAENADLRSQLVTEKSSMQVRCQWAVAADLRV